LASFRAVLHGFFSNRNVVALTVSDFAFIIGVTVWWPFQALYIIELGATTEQLGILLTSQAIVSVVFQYPGGVLADRYGRKRMIMVGAILRSIPPLIYLLTDSWLFFFPGLLIDAVAIVDFPAWNALLMESLSTESRGAGYGLYRTISGLPGIFIQPIGGVIMDAFGIVLGTRLCLAVNEVTMVVYALIIRFFVSEPVQTEAARPLRERHGSLLSRVRALPTIWVLILSGSLLGFGQNLTTSYLVVYAIENIGLTKTQWGIISAAFSVLAMSLTTPSGFLGDRVGRKSCILITQVLTLFSTLIFVNSRAFYDTLAARAVAGVGQGFGGWARGPMMGSNWQALIADVTPGPERGRMLGLIGTVMGAITTPSTGIGGYLYQNVSSVIPFYLNAGLTGLGTLLIALFLKEPKEKAR